MNEQLTLIFTEAILWALTVVGVASVGVRVLTALTGITPWTWDDVTLNRIGKVISIIQIVLNTIALNWNKSDTPKGDM